MPDAPRTIAVASVPSGHVYVRHLSDPGGDDGVHRLPDPPPAGGGGEVPGRWWPPAMLDPEWIAANRGTFDVFHIHFGFDEKDPGELEAIADALDAAGVPLVLTVHDLRNPHLRDPGRHSAQLGVLAGRAAELVTLTPGAAAQVAERFGRACTVLPHPHVVGLEDIGRPRAPRDGFVVGVHAKSLRANTDAEAVCRALAGIVAGLPGARLRIDLHEEVSDPAAHAHAPDVARRLRTLAAAHDHVRLVEHPAFSDDELWSYLRGLDVSVLPYRFGTHSGWLEACFDLGTAVAVPTCGFYAEQRPCHPFGLDEDGLDRRSLERAIHAAHAIRRAPRARRADRRRERRAVARAHRALYERVLAEHPVRPLQASGTRAPCASPSSATTAPRSAGPPPADRSR